MLDPGPVAVDWRAQASGSVLAGLFTSGIWGLVDNGVGGFEWDTFLVRASAFAVLWPANLAVQLWLTRRRGGFVVVLRGYDRDRVDSYRQNVTIARERGLPDPPPPSFPMALRGYEPTQVDDWVASLARRT